MWKNVRDGVTVAVVVWSLLYLISLGKVLHAFFQGSPQIKAELHDLVGVALDVRGGVYTFQNRREYSLTVKNIGPRASVPIELYVQFPFLVEASNVVLVDKADGVHFAPRATMLVPHGSPVAISGCQASTAYELKADKLYPTGTIKILLILNDAQTESTVNNFIAGHFFYEHLGRTTKGRVYFPLEIDDNRVVKLSPSPSILPSAVIHRFDVSMLPLPCIPNDSLVDR
jgi:hypothetical protein